MGQVPLKTEEALLKKESLVKWTDKNPCTLLIRPLACAHTLRVADEGKPDAEMAVGLGVGLSTAEGRSHKSREREHCFGSYRAIQRVGNRASELLPTCLTEQSLVIMVSSPKGCKLIDRRLAALLAQMASRRVINRNWLAEIVGKHGSSPCLALVTAFLVLRRLLLKSAFLTLLTRKTVPSFLMSVHYPSHK